jgi:hypothetical protein
MNTDKNIDRLFRERLENLEATPNKKVWKEIESKITKKKRKVFPFWWFSSDIAALLIIGFSLFTVHSSMDVFRQNPPKKIITKTPKYDIESFVKDSSEIKIVQKIEKKTTTISKKLINKGQQKKVSR